MESLFMEAMEGWKEINNQTAPSNDSPNPLYNHNCEQCGGDDFIFDDCEGMNVCMGCSLTTRATIFMEDRDEIGEDGYSKGGFKRQRSGYKRLRNFLKLLHKNRVVLSEAERIALCVHYTEYERCYNEHKTNRKKITNFTFTCRHLFEVMDVMYPGNSFGNIAHKFADLKCRRQRCNNLSVFTKVVQDLDWIYIIETMRKQQLLGTIDYDLDMQTLSTENAEHEVSRRMGLKTMYEHRLSEAGRVMKHKYPDIPTRMKAAQDTIPAVDLQFKQAITSVEGEVSSTILKSKSESSNNEGKGGGNGVGNMNSHGGKDILKPVSIAEAADVVLPPDSMRTKQIVQQRLHQLELKDSLKMPMTRAQKIYTALLNK